MTSVTVSAPGKVLLAGGYLVLERPNAGLVVAANRRFYSTVQPGATPNRICLRSPQFHASWEYEFDAATSNIQPCTSNNSVNSFVEKTLRVCLLYLFDPDASNQVSLDITIQADNDFYSVMPHLPSGARRTPDVVDALERFLPCPKDDQGKTVVHKTGLGSSAALCTSLVAALCHFYADRVLKALEEEDEDDRPTLDDIIHNLSQICHCHAQGKVGSGFDVSAACHGTHIYRRFATCFLPDLLDQLDHEEAHGGFNARPTLVRLAETATWHPDMVNSLTFPQGLQILLADVRGGSESPSMARKVLQWKHGQMVGGPIPHWNDLQTLNKKTTELMQALSEGSMAVDYDALAVLPSSEWPEESPLKQLATAFAQIRANLKELGDAAGVPIEPDEQTKLCDATSQLPGVVTCLVPGAGGYDAVVCLYIERPAVLEAIGNLWADWAAPTICPLAVRASQEGMRVEQDWVPPCSF
eukprot:Nitzschia sp. Nitz4//scaffold18_size181773//34377//35961//NITZ4_001901-RA/size181773-processed-gene-0.6-mRNA-1//1//CDS//3329539969//2558//frame0